MAMNRQTVLNKPKDSKKTFKRLIAYIAGSTPLIVFLLIMCFAANVLGLLGPWLAGKAINVAEAGAGNVDMSRILYYAAFMLVCYLVSSVLGIVINMIMTHMSKRVAKKMRQDAFEKLQRLPVSYFDKNKTGDIISRVFYDVDVISTCIASDLTNMLTNVVTVAGSFVMMLVICPPLVIIEVAAIPVSIAFTAHMRKKTQPRYRERSKKYGALNSYVEEILTGHKTVQAYAYEKKAEERFSKLNTEAAEGYYDAEYYGFAISPTINFISYCSLALIAMFGAVLYMYGWTTLGQISSFILYSRKFSGPIDEISSIINELFSMLAAAERVFEVLDEEEEAEKDAGTLELTNIKGNVELRSVSFGYEKDKEILHDLDLTAESGSMTAIVGPTGAGKTTIINLLMRFYDADAGSILVDGKDVRDYERKSLRSAYAMVLQDTWVFEGTIFDNIAYGKEDATTQEVTAAAKAARIHSFIMQLPEGYNTIISENGGNISKGQKQLLTIARAMLYDVKMLILDEATSNVDTGTERYVQEAMRELMKGKTCFVIAHRISTIKNADQIIVLKDGAIAETGTHAELMRRGGVYSALYLSQFQLGVDHE